MGFFNRVLISSENVLLDVFTLEIVIIYLATMFVLKRFEDTPEYHVFKRKS